MFLVGLWWGQEVTVSLAVFLHGELLGSALAAAPHPPQASPEEQSTTDQ
jgi:hypothetical protein